MRKITKQAAEAFKAGTKFTSGNTAVFVEGEDVCLALHGHIIARRRFYRGLRLEVSMCGWETVTTCERLNGLLPDGLQIVQRDGKQRWYARGLWLHNASDLIDVHATYALNLETGDITCLA